MLMSSAETYEARSGGGGVDKAGRDQELKQDWTGLTKYCSGVVSVRSWFDILE